MSAFEGLGFSGVAWVLLVNLNAFPGFLLLAA
jgi:hypothetical protein